MLGLTILLITATTYRVLTGLSDFPELAHLILTKIFFKYCYYPPFYRLGNCGPEVLSGWLEVRIPFTCSLMKYELKARPPVTAPWEWPCGAVLSNLPSWHGPLSACGPAATPEVHTTSARAPRSKALGHRGSWLHQEREGTGRLQARKAKWPLGQKGEVLALDGKEKVTEKNLQAGLQGSRSQTTSRL